VLGKFPNSENAARAAIAAGKQGKFWEMHHMIFSHQDQLTQQGLDGFAKELGLDVGRLHADMQSPETADRIAKDHKLGEDLKIEGTPSIFINGRQFEGHQDLNDWINLELTMVGKAPEARTDSTAAAKDAGASAKPPASAPSASAAAPKR
jgi:protein-disulfide isomerase